VDSRLQRVIIVTGLANLAVLAAKTIVGISTGSLALLGDAIHSLADLANNVVALVVVRLAGAPPDREHPYGHQKFETLAVFGLAVLLAVLAIEIILRAAEPGARTIVEHEWGLAIMLGVLVVNVAVTTWERKWARILRSEILRADAQHTLSDVLVTLGVIVGWQFAARGYPWLDTVFAFGVALVVMFLSYGLFRRAIPVLVDRISHEPESIASVLRSVEGIRDVRRIRSRWVGLNSSVDVVVTVAPELPTSEAHAVADAIEKTLLESFDIEDVTVHIEPHEPPEASSFDSAEGREIERKDAKVRGRKEKTGTGKIK
jgi:cation diffusion facilitator family transporter